MGNIVISENVTLDGVVQDPAGAEGFERGGWVGRIGERGRAEAAKVLLDEALGAEAQLFGRRTYEFLAARWPARSGELADRLNEMPKYVVSSTLKDPDWNNATVLAGDAVQEVSKLKDELEGEIVVAGSIPGRTRTLAVGIYSFTETGQDEQAAALLAISVAIAFAAVLVSNRLARDSV